MADDVLLNKAAIVERCLARVRDLDAVPDALADLTRQDAIVLNLQRAAQAAIDLAMHLVRAGGLGLPETSREAFALLADHAGLDADLSLAMQRMVGFRNVAVHSYQALNLDVVRAILDDGLADVDAFSRWAVRQSS